MMARKPLNAEEIAELRSSPYVASVIGNKISFTPEFKRMAYDQITSGKTMREVFEGHGIDPEILGDSRIWAFTQKLRAKAERDEGFFKNGKCYLSTILDAFTHEVLAYRVSLSLKVNFVLETTDQLIAEHGSTLDNETIVHSDQGCHYTSYAFIQKLKDAEFVQSMSRRGNCWDNSPQESFFGHMKDEIADLIAACTTFEQVVARVDDWMDYYNNDRGQWDLLKLAPKEYYEYLQTGIYPLPVYVKPSSRGSAPNPEV